MRQARHKILSTVAAASCPRSDWPNNSWANQTSTPCLMSATESGRNTRMQNLASRPISDTKTPSCPQLPPVPLLIGFVNLLAWHFIEVGLRPRMAWHRLRPLPQCGRPSAPVAGDIANCDIIIGFRSNTHEQRRAGAATERSFPNPPTIGDAGAWQPRSHCEPSCNMTCFLTYHGALVTKLHARSPTSSPLRTTCRVCVLS